MSIKSILYFPPDFFGNKTKKDKSVTPCEALMRELISHHQGINVADVKRGDESKKEPDFKIGGEWVEIRYSEEKAQRHMKQEGSYQSNRTLQLFIEEVQHAIEAKAKKTYSVDNVAVGILSLIDTTLFSCENKGNKLHDCIIKQRDDFFEHLVQEYITTGIFKNIYIVTIGYDRVFVVFDIKKFNDYEDFIYHIGIKEGSNVPYRIFDKFD